jgi:predicted AAA+ superfamily ATPase
MDLISRFFNPPNQSYFLFGPRGTGKTTWLKAKYPNALWIDLLNLDVLRFYLAAPERLREVVQALPDHSVIIIDEVQKIPDILSEVHWLIEQKRGLQFILTGSSARKLKRAGVDLLAGRALLKHMSPFFAAELGARFDLKRALEIGMVPLIALSESPEEVLQTYAGIYLKEEVYAESLVRKIEDFARFLEVISFSHANQINLSNISRECEVSRKTVESYLQILQDLLLAFILPIFSHRAQRALVDHPKLYIFDAGVFRSLRPQSLKDQSSEIQGAALEGLVAQHIKAWIHNQIGNYQMSFWRTRSGLEVDFVVLGPQGFWAIEVKNSTKIHPQDLRSLLEFKKDYPECKPLFLYRGTHRMVQQDILCIPCEEFLLQVSPSHKTLWTTDEPSDQSP